MSKKTSAPKKSEASGRNSVTKLGQELIAAVKEMKAIQRGERLPSRRWEVLPDGKGGFSRRLLIDNTAGAAAALSNSSGAELALAARKKLGLSQDKFAALIGVPAGTLRGWEQGRRDPAGAARVLLMVAREHPEAVLDAIKVQAA